MTTFIPHAMALTLASRCTHSSRCLSSPHGMWQISTPHATRLGGHNTWLGGPGLRGSLTLYSTRWDLGHIVWDFFSVVLLFTNMFQNMLFPCSQFAISEMAQRPHELHQCYNLSEAVKEWAILEDSRRAMLHHPACTLSAT